MLLFVIFPHNFFLFVRICLRLCLVPSDDIRFGHFGRFWPFWPFWSNFFSFFSSFFASVKKLQRGPLTSLTSLDHSIMEKTRGTDSTAGRTGRGKNGKWYFLDVKSVQTGTNRSGLPGENISYYSNTLSYSSSDSHISQCPS